MAYRSFRHFLETLEQAGELTRVADPVDTNLLIAEWADREMKSPSGGKGLLFEQPVVDGQVSKFPVAINTMGSRKRIAMALEYPSRSSASAKPSMYGPLSPARNRRSVLGAQK